MSNPTKEERASKLFQEGEKIILAGGGSRGYPTQEAVAEEIRQAEEAARHEGYTEAMKDVDENINAKAMADAAADHSALYTPKSAEVSRGALPTKDPIHVSLLMNVDQDKANGFLMELNLHDCLDIEGLEFQEAVHLFGEWFTRMQKSLHAIGPRPIPLSERKF